MNVTIKLNDTQVQALKKLDMGADVQKLVENAAATAIRGKFSYMAKKAEEQTSKHFDFVANAGVKLDTDKGAFVNKYMLEIRDILNNL
jgi:hypothetical protein